METPSGQVTIVSLPVGSAARAQLIGELLGAGTGRPQRTSAAVAAVLVAGEHAAAVGEAVSALRAAGLAAAGWVGDPSDPAVREMAAELFPGHEIVVRS